MIKFVVFVASLAVVCQAAPGGYLAKGGVYTELGLNKDYIGAAAQAGKMAWAKQIESEAEIGIEQNRGARQSQAAYVPSFYTAHQAPPAPHQAQAQPVFFESQQQAYPYARTARDTYYEAPLYYYSS